MEPYVRIQERTLKEALKTLGLLRTILLKTWWNGINKINQLMNLLTT